MKIRVYSDIHLDWYAEAFYRARSAARPGVKDTFDPFWYPPELPDDKETILILSGDLWVGTNWIEWAQTSWISKVAPRFKKVLIVLGNHDYWPQGDLSITKGADKCNALLQDMGLDNVLVLDASTYEEGEYIFVGATLWTDINKQHPLMMLQMNQFMRYDGEIVYSTGPDGAWERFTSPRWVQTHFKHRDYIRFVASNNPDKKIIVCTHHVPLTTLVDPKYKFDESNAYYVSDLSDLILDNENIKLWTYGHTHCQNDTWMVHCRLYNNAVGYRTEIGYNNCSHEVIEI